MTGNGLEGGAGAPQRPSALVLAVGSPWRGDDGVGVAVGRQVAERLVGAGLGGRVEVVEGDGEPARTIELWDGRELVVVVDATVSGVEPGTVTRLDVDLGRAMVDRTPPSGADGTPSLSAAADAGAGADAGPTAPSADLGPGGAGAGGGSHAMGLADAVELGRALRRLPDRLVVVGVEAAGFGHTEGIALDPRVASALDAAVAAVVDVLTGPGTPEPRESGPGAAGGPDRARGPQHGPGDHGSGAPDPDGGAGRVDEVDRTGGPLPCA